MYHRSAFYVKWTGQSGTVLTRYVKKMASGNWETELCYEGCHGVSLYVMSVGLLNTIVF